MERQSEGLTILLISSDHVFDVSRVRIYQTKFVESRVIGHLVSVGKFWERSKIG